MAMVSLQDCLQVLESPLQLIDKLLVSAGWIMDPLHLLLETSLNPIHPIVIEIVLMLRVVDLEGGIVVVVVRVVRVITLIVHLILVHF
jgi:hypothetical protein